MNEICTELKKIGFPELCEPKGIDQLLTNYLVSFQKAIIRKAKAQNAPFAGMPLSETGILATVQMPKMSFF